MPIDVHTFEGGLDRDSSEHVMQPNTYRYALNIRNSGRKDGDVGVITNLEGNSAVSMTLPSGGNKVVGAKDDPANQRSLFIVANTNGDNRIFEYNYQDNAVYTVIEDFGNALELASDRLIASIDIVVSQSDDYMLFTDGETEPKYINISAGKRTYDPTLKIYKDIWIAGTSSADEGDVYRRVITSGGVSRDYFYLAKQSTNQNPTANLGTPFPQSNWELCPRGLIYSQTATEEFTTVVKPPTNTPFLEYGSQPRGYNKIKGSLWQMRYKYVKADGRESGYSPISNCPLPKEVADSVLNTGLEDTNKNNVLNLSIEIPESLSYKSIKIEVRQNNSEGVALSDFKQAEELDLNDLTNTGGALSIGNYQFDNNKYLIPTNPDIANQLFSNVPVKANAQAVTSENRILFGGITEGNPIDKSILREHQPSLSQNTTSSPWETSGTTEVYINDIDAGTLTLITSPPYSSQDNIRATSITGASEDKEVWLRFNGYNEGDLINARIWVTTDYVNTIEGTSPVFPEGISNSTWFNQQSGKNDSDFGDVGKNTWLFNAQVEATESPSDPGNIERGIAEAMNDAFQGGNGYVTQTWVYEFLDFVYGSNAITTRVENTGGNWYFVVAPEDSKMVNLQSPGTQIRRTYIAPTILPKVDGAVSMGGFGYTDSESNLSLKKGGTHEFSIIYTDEYGRLSQAIDSSNFTINLSNWWKSDDINNTGAESAVLTINHEAPEWATKWYLAKTRGSGVKDFVYLPTSKITNLPDVGTLSNLFNDKWFLKGYIDQTAYTTDDSIGGTDFIYIPLNALIGGYTSSYRAISQSDISYEFEKGDRIKFAYVYDNGATKPTLSGFCGAGSVNGDVDVEIVGYIPDYNCIYVRTEDLPSSWVGATAASNPYAGIFNKANEDGTFNNKVKKMLFQLYTPDVENDNEFYYETGIFGGISGSAHTYNGVVQDSVNGLDVSLLGFGDVYLKPRTYVTEFDPTVTTSGYTSVLTTYFVEDENFYDKSPSASYSVGRPNRAFRKTTQEEDFVGNIGQIVRPNSLRWTEKFIPEAGFNGFGTVLDSSFKDVNSKFRDIMYLHSEGDRVIIFQKNRVGFVMTGRQILTQSNGETQLLSNNTPVSDETYYAGDYGISNNPESFAYNGNRKYFTDVNTGTVLRLSMDGLTPISKKGMHSYFVEKFRELQQSNEKYYCVGEYDLANDEYQLFLYQYDLIEPFSFTHDSAASTVTITTPQNMLEDVGNSIELQYTYDIDFPPTPVYTVTDTGTGEITSKDALSTVIEIDGALNSIMTANTDNPSFKIKVTEKKGAVVYSESVGAWTSFLSYAPEYISNVGNEFASFKSGTMYLHTNSAAPNNFFGVNDASYIDVVSNQYGNVVKNWLTLGLKTDAFYGDETDFKVTTPSDTDGDVEDTLPSGVVTSDQYYSTAGAFKFKEQQLFAPYLRAVNSGDNFVEGKKVRGFWNRTRVRINAGANKIYSIFSVSFNYITSPFTK